MLDMWKELGSSGQVERSECWDFILADEELASIMGRGDAERGKAMLYAMKAVRALDANGDGMVDGFEFQRLYLPSNVLAAGEATRCGLDSSFLYSL